MFSLTSFLLVIGIYAVKQDSWCTELFKKVVRVYVLIKPKEIHHIEATPLSQMGSFDPTLPMVQPKHFPQCQPKNCFLWQAELKLAIAHLYTVFEIMGTNIPILKLMQKVIFIISAIMNICCHQLKTLSVIENCG